MVCEILIGNKERELIILSTEERSPSFSLFFLNFEMRKLIVYTHEDPVECEV